VKIGDYAVEGTIGQGGRGTVVRARSDRGEEVAIKILLSPKLDRVKRFQRERKLLEKLGKMPGFVPILDWGESKMGPYLVMPFVAGGSLAERLKRARLSPGETASIGATLAHSLGRAHAKGIVHRDLKPDNILFTRLDEPLVADLGLAKHFRRPPPGAADSGERYSATGDFRGTCGYMAPEQIRDSKSVGPACDVFALGAILYECLTGEPAFPGNMPVQNLANIAAFEGGALDQPRLAVPDWLKETIRACLAFDPKDRPRNGAALAKLMYAGRGTKTRGGGRRGRRLLVLLAALAVLAGLAYWKHGDRLDELQERVLELIPRRTR